MTVRDPPVKPAGTGPPSPAGPWVVGPRGLSAGPPTGLTTASPEDRSWGLMQDRVQEPWRPCGWGLSRSLPATQGVDGRTLRRQ